ncbi:MAG: peptidase domain-containing ABC transporter [Candidatus Latescibacteria bacterium]|nr:peptidase domain-containing ABC transporter [Candidatus Latescibacterota bacterium]
MDINSLLQFIRQNPLFSIYSDEEMSSLLETAELESVSAGQLVFEQGDVGDTFYIVYSGKIRILHKDENQKEVNLGVISKGDHFGETALITDHPRNAAARAVDDSVLLSIHKDSFYKYLLHSSKQREYFDKFIRFTSVHRFLKSCTDLSAVPVKELKELIDNFKPEFFSEGEAVFRQDTIPDKFYLIERGKIKVVRWEEAKPEIINFLHEGDFFGEKALFEETVRYADIICLTDCHLFSISREAFNEFIIRSPKLKKVIEDRIQSYSTEKPPIPYHEMIKQELAGLKDIKAEKKLPDEDLEPTVEDKNRLKKLTSYYHQHIRFPFIMQHDEMTCGTTCIMMIAKFYGKNFSSSRLRELAHVDISGSSLANLASAAEQLGFATRGLKIDYDTLISAHHPCIIHWQGYHYVVIYKITDSNVWVSDPALGLRKYTRDYFNNNWNGITLTLEPTPEFETKNEDKSSLKNFMQFILPYKQLLLEIFAASLLLNVFGLATPIFTQNVIDKVIAHSNVTMLNIMIIGMIIVLIFRILVSIIRQYLIVHTSMKIDLRMLVTFYKHMLALPLGYFKVRKIGDFISRFGENLKIRNFMTNIALTLILDTILIIVYLSLMFYYNAHMTGLVLLFLPLFIGITIGFSPILKRFNIDSFAANVESRSHLIESMNAIDTVKAMNIEYPIRWKWEDKFIKSLNIDFKLNMATMYFNSFGDFVGTISSTIILWFGALKVMQGVLSVGELMAFMSLMGSVISPINRIIMAWDDVQQTLVSVDRLNDVFTAKAEFPETMDDETGLVFKEPRGEIAFDEVYFRYGGEDEAYILSNITFKIAPGQKIAIVGRSGSGKSTLVRLLARFYDVTEGKITIDNFSINNINLASLRKIVGFVLQESFLFNGTIRENISLGDPEESLEKVIEAAKMANSHEFISNLALGYETKVGESGLQLSGGQKQRIAIARVLYSKPRIIVLDEATSSLDTESERAIQKNMQAILADKTAIIIAHRLSTVRNADKIIVLDDGEIVEMGTHEELMDKHGLYHYLNHQQLNL